MKTFRKAGMALCAILFCVNFVSCEKEGGLTGIGQGKKISKIVQQASDGKPEIAIYTFSYDKKGRLIEATDNWENDLYTFYFDWSDCAIVSNYQTLTLKSGLVVESGENTSYTYNDAGRLIQCEWPSNKCTIHWNDDKVVFVDDLDCGSTRFSYGSSCKNGYFPIIADNIIYTDIDLVLLMAHPEIVGIRTTQLPVSEDDGKVLYSYEFDKDGYVAKIIKEYTSGYNKGVIETWDITWE